MENSESWTLTLVFRDVTGKKEISEDLSFPSRETAEAAIKEFRESDETKTGKTFSIRNPAGESIDFRAATWLRQTIKKDPDFSGIL